MLFIRMPIYNCYIDKGTLQEDGFFFFKSLHSDESMNLEENIYIYSCFFVCVGVVSLVTQSTLNLVLIMW